MEQVLGEYTQSEPTHLQSRVRGKSIAGFAAEGTQGRDEYTAHQTYRTFIAIYDRRQTWRIIE